MTQSLPLNFSGLIGTNSSRAECHRSASGEPMEQQVLTTLRDQVGPIMLGTVFLFVGVVACALSPIRGRKEKGILLWFGLLNIMWGARILADAPAAFSMLPRTWWASRVDAIAILSYVTVVPALLFFLEMSRGILRRLLQIMLLADFGTCLAGIYSVLRS